jgi:hypothetical protein
MNKALSLLIVRKTSVSPVPVQTAGPFFRDRGAGAYQENFPGEAI